MLKTANNDSISRPNSRPKLLFPGKGKGNYIMPQEGKFEAYIPGNHGKREFPLTPAMCTMYNVHVSIIKRMVIMSFRYNIALFLCTYLLPMVGLLLSYLQVFFADILSILIHCPF